MCFNVKFVNIGHFWITLDVTFQTSRILLLLFIFRCFYCFITLQFSLDKNYSEMIARILLLRQKW